MPVVDSLIGELHRRFDLNYDGLTDLLEIYEKVCNIDRQLLKAEMKTFKAYATVLNYILNPEHTPFMSGELQSYTNLQTVMRLALTLPVSSATCERSFSAMRLVKKN